MLVRIEDGAEILAQKPGGAPVSALAWNADGANCSRSAGGRRAGHLYEL